MVWIAFGCGFLLGCFAGILGLEIFKSYKIRKMEHRSTRKLHQNAKSHKDQSNSSPVSWSRPVPDKS